MLRTYFHRTTMDTLRLLHTADVHLGFSAAAFGARAAQHRELLRAAFARVVDEALARGAQLLLIAGDLFDTDRPAPRTVAFAWSQLQRLAEVSPALPAVILPGTHDPLRPGSVYAEWLRRGLPPHLHLLNPTDPAPLALYGGEVLVHAAGAGRLPRAQGEARFHLGLAHGSVPRGDVAEAAGPLYAAGELAASGLHYLALGHWHSPGDYSEGGVAARYPGSPEILAIDQSEQGSALQVDLRSGTPPRVELLSTGRLRRLSHVADVSACDSAAQLVEDLRRLAEDSLLLDVELTGLAAPDFAYDPEEIAADLAPSFFRVRVRDHAALATADLNPDRYPAELVAGRFVRLMLERLQAAEAAGEEERAQIEREALQLGLACLEGRGRPG